MSVVRPWKRLRYATASDTQFHTSNNIHTVNNSSSASSSDSDSDSDLVNSHAASATNSHNIGTHPAVFTSSSNHTPTSVSKLPIHTFRDFLLTRHDVIWDTTFGSSIAQVIGHNSALFVHLESIRSLLYTAVGFPNGQHLTFQSTVPVPQPCDCCGTRIQPSPRIWKITTVPSKTSTDASIIVYADAVCKIKLQRLSELLICIRSAFDWIAHCKIIDTNMYWTELQTRLYAIQTRVAYVQKLTHYYHPVQHDCAKIPGSTFIEPE